jgi:hypothetical protein
VAVNRKELLPEIPWPTVDKPRTRGVNTLEGDDDFGLADLGRLQQQYAHEPAVYREMKHRYGQARTSEAAVNSMKKEHRELPLFQAHLLEAQRTAAKLEPRMALYKASSRERVNEQAVNVIGREYSERAINSWVNSRSDNLEAQVSGASAAWQGYGALSQQRSNILNQMQGLRHESMEAASTYIAGKGIRAGGVNLQSEAVLQGNAAQMKDLAQQLIPITVAMQQLKQQGQDPASRQRELIGIGEKAAGVLGHNQLEAEMKSGKGLGALSPADLKKKEAEAAEKLVKALDELRNSAGKTKEELEGLQKNAEEAAEEFKEVSEARGMDGDGGGRKFETAKVVAGAVMESLAAMTTGYSNVMINQPLQMVSNATGAANIENEKYNMWHQAIAGDMTARMTLGAWDTGNAFGNELADRQNFVHRAKEVNAGIGAGVGVLQMGFAVGGTGGTVVGNNAVTNFAQGAQTFIGSTVSGIQEEAARQRQTEMGALRIQGTHAMVNASKAMNYIPGQQFQKYRDYVVGLNATATEMGGSVGEAFLNETSGTDFMQKMYDKGVGLKEMGALSAQGALGMGSMFKSSQVLEAVGLENSGFGSAANNMRRMATLGASGTGDPGQNLSKIIEEGMQRGLNSSKAIDMIVENTARATEESVKLGYKADPTEFLTKTILGAIDRSNPNKELAGQIAQETYRTGEAARSNISASFPGMINVARVTRAAGLEFDQATGLMMTQMDTKALNAHAEDTKEEFKAFLEQRGWRRSTIEGLGARLDDPKSFIQGINEAKAVSELSQTSGLSLVSGLPGELVQQIKKYKDRPEILEQIASLKDPNALPAELRDLRAPIALALSTANQNPDAVLRSVITQIVGPNWQPKETNNTIAQEAAKNKSHAEGQVEARGGKTAEVGQALTAGKYFGASGTSGANAIESLANSLRNALKKAGTDAEEKWTTAAGESAASFGASAKSLNHASGQLDAAAKVLLEGSGAMNAASNIFKQWVEKITVATEPGVKELKRFKRSKK